MQQPHGHPMGSIPPTNITTEQIQKCLDENKQLILAILDNQNLGRLAECAEYQAKLQKNLLYLAAIADAQPQSPAMRPQMTPHAGGAGQYVQQPGPNFPPKALLQFAPQQVQELQQQQQLHHQPHMMPFPMRPVGIFDGSNEAQSEAKQGATPSKEDDGSHKNSEKIKTP